MTLRTMAGALWYLQSRSTVNAIRARLRRLRQPKYLVGAVLGTVYLLAFFGRGMLAGRWSRRDPVDPVVMDAAGRMMAENIGAAALLGFLLMGWFFAKDRAALTFTEAEVTNLFPAPLSRRLLLLYRILRGQGSILFSTAFVLLFTGRVFQGTGAVTGAVGWWLILSILSLHGMGASFAVQRLAERGMAGWRRRLLTLAVPLGALAALWFWYQSLPPSPGVVTADREGLSRWEHFAGEVFRSGPAPWLLWPFRLVVRPLFATGLVDAAWRLLPAAGLLVLHGYWVIRSAVSFEEASIEQSRRLAELRTAMTAGSGRTVARKRIREPFALAPTGPRWMALWWSGLIESHDTRRRWSLIAALVILVGVGIRVMTTEPSLRVTLGTIAVGVCALLVLLGGQSAAQRFSRAMGDLDRVKALPVPGWELFLGTVLGGLTGMVLLEWLLLLFAAILLPGSFMEAPVSVGFIWGLGAMLSALVPVATLFFAIPVSIGFALFPAWFAAAKGGPGIEATGQRMLVGLIQLASLLIAVIPVLLVSVPLFLLGQYLVGIEIGILLAGVAGTLVLGGECVAGIWWVGHSYDRLDAAEER